MFALQDGGMCLSSSTAHKNFHQYSMSSQCKSDGRGGIGANHVYVIGGMDGMIIFYFRFIEINEPNEE